MLQEIILVLFFGGGRALYVVVMPCYEVGVASKLCACMNVRMHACKGTVFNHIVI